jgi:tripartite-type tricarboxylate transporter receptor subunit TctC
MRRILLALVPALMIGAASALDYPTKNITIIVPYGPGGATDLATRALIDSIPSGILPSGISFVITNMPGGSGLIGTNYVVNARPDGYTLCGITGDFAYSRARGTTNLSVDSFEPLIWTQVDPYLLLIKAGMPYTNLKEFVEHTRANPGKVKFGDSGPGAIPHLVGIAMARALGLDIRAISYDTSLEAAIAVVNGEAQATALHSTAAAGQLRAGEVIPIAVSSTVRSGLFPNVPTIAETFADAKDLNIVSTISVSAPKGTPPEVVNYLRRIFMETVKTDAYKARLKNFQAQDISHYTVDDTKNLYNQLAEYYVELSK